jgi:hypothetical protein
LDDQGLKSSCDNLEGVLKKDEKSDIDAKELYGVEVFTRIHSKRKNEAC